MTHTNLLVFFCGVHHLGTRFNPINFELYIIFNDRTPFPIYLANSLRTLPQRDDYETVVALVIFSRWHPLRAIAGALLFSTSVAVQMVLHNSGIKISPFLLECIPYIMTLLVLIAWGGNRKQSAPASLGRVFQGSK